MPPKLTPDQFAESVKTKYPAYKDVDNSVLTQKMLAKYPQYSDRVEMNQPTAPKETSFGQKILNAGTAVSDFVGGKGVADLIGGSIAKVAHPEYAKEVTMPTGKEVAGSALQLGSLALPFGEIAKGAQLGLKALKVAPKVAKAGGTIASGALGGYGFDVGQNLQENKGLTESITPGINTVIGATIPAVPLALKGAAKLVPKSEGIMQRVARLTPSEANKFKQMTGETHGEYLTRTGNFGTPEKIVDNEFSKFQASKKEVDDTLAKIPGTFKDTSVKTALNDLIAREKKIGIAGGDSVRVNELNKKYNSGGLNQSEINEVKRLFERNVKTNFLTERNTIGIDRANRVDNAIRNWQFKTAEGLGFKNLPELNKQTQASKFIVDKLGKQFVGKEGNDLISLSDMMFLAGGNIQGVAGFIAKRTLGSNLVRSKAASLLNKKPIELPIKADFQLRQPMTAPIKIKATRSNISPKPTKLNGKVKK